MKIILNDVFEKQTLFQKHVEKEKRYDKHFTNPYVKAMFFKSCMDIELCEYFDSDSSNEVEELADVFHFLLAVFIYSGVKALSDYTCDNYEYGKKGKRVTELKIDFNYLVCKFLEHIPFKIWKEKKKEIDYNKVQILADGLISKFFQFVKAQRISCEEFIKAYDKKLQINYDRQENGY